MFNLEEFKFNTTCNIEGVCRRAANLLTQGDYFLLEENFSSLFNMFIRERNDNQGHSERSIELLGEVVKLRSENNQLYTRIDSLMNVVDEMGEVLDKTLAERDYLRDEVMELSNELRFVCTRITEQSALAGL